jgi:sarcosine dehydrogenase
VSNATLSHAQVLIIGGGVIGCSTAYHLARLGVTDTVLLERHELTSGTTFHAAGLVGQLRTNANVTQLLRASVELYSNLEKETGLATGWKMNGGLRLACNEDRWTEVRRQATTAQSFGLEMHLLSAGEARALWPIMCTDDLVGAAFIPSDGQINPSDLTRSLARGARAAGANLIEGIQVQRIDMEGGRVRGVETSNGYIACEVLVACAGQWTRDLSRQIGVNVPLLPIAHQYMVSERIEGVTAQLPTLRDPDNLLYFKEEVGGLVMGGYEPNPQPITAEQLRANNGYHLIQPDFGHFEQFMEPALARVPALADVGVKQLFNGSESFTPDGNFVLGRAPEVDNYFVGAGFNAFGIASAGGAGMALANWINDGEAPFDLWPVDIRRFGSAHRDASFVATRTCEAYGRHYTIAWPALESESGRPLLRSPLYAQLSKAGACFGEKLGWERANWFADTTHGETPVDQYSMGRPAWFDAVGREHHAARNAVVLVDQSSFAKYELMGPDAHRVLTWLCAADVDKPVGSIVYTQLLNDSGGIECDLTVTRKDEQSFYLVTGTGFVTHDFDWIKRSVPADADIQLADVTSDYVVLSLMGPTSRRIFESATDVDVSNAAFPFGTAQLVSIAGAPVWALRVSYVGELGWELHLPADHATGVYSELLAAGRDSSLRLAGYRAIESLRLEKGYRAWGADIGPDYTPFEAGLGWAIRKSDVPFKGADALRLTKGKPLTKRLVGFTLQDQEAVLHGRETILRDGEPVGWLSSGGFGYSVGKPIGYGYVRDKSGVDLESIRTASFELDVGGERLRAVPHTAPLIDPKMLRMKS